MTELPKIKKFVEVPVQTWGDLVAYATRHREPEIRVGDTVTRNDIREGSQFPSGVVGVVIERGGGLVFVMWPYGDEIKTACVYAHLLRVYPMPPDTPLFD
jgi:hypothetical protein